MGAIFSPDGRFVMTGGRDETAILWDVATGREIRRFEGHKGWAVPIRFSPDGQFVLIEDRGGIARLWDIVAGKVMLQFTRSRTMSVAVSPDGRFVLTGDWDGIATLWEVATGREARRFGRHQGQVSPVDFSPDGQFALTMDRSGTVRLWNIATGQMTRTFIGHTGEGRCVAFSPDGQVMVTGSADGTARVWDLETGREIRRLEGHAGHVSDVAFSPDGRLVTTLSETNRTVRFWDITTGDEVRRLQRDALNVDSAFSFVDLSLDGRFLLMEVTNPNVIDLGRSVYLFDATTAQEVRRFEPLSADVSAVVFSPDGRWILAGGGYGVAHLWDVSTGQVIQHFDEYIIGRPGCSAAFSPDGNLLLTVGYKESLDQESMGGNNFARLWEVATGREVRRFIGHTDEVLCVAFSSDGRHAATGSKDGTSRLWEVTTGREVRRFTESSTINAISFSPDGRSVLTTDLCCTAYLWDVATGQLTWTQNIEPGGGAISSATFSPDGHSLLIKKGSDAFLVDITGWVVRRFGELQRWDGPSPPAVFSAAFSRDGRFVLTGNSDNTARLWDVATVKASGRYIGGRPAAWVGPVAGEMRRLEGHGGEVWSTAFSSDGRFALTGSPDNTVRLWDTATGRELCRLILFRDGTWVVVDPDGRFDTNNLDNNRGLHWIMPDDPLMPLPLEIFMRDYYEPRLLPRILAGEKFRPVRALQDLNRVQPAVRITKIEAQTNTPDTVAVTVAVAKAAREFQRGGKRVKVETSVYDLHLFRDGQLVGYAPESEGEVALAPKTGTATRTFTVKLPRTADKKEMEFSAYAFNVDRVKSATARQTFTLPAELKPMKGRAYVITVGVNAYDNPTWDLQFAANDSRRIEQTLRERLAGTRDYAEVISIPLISDHEKRNGERVVTENRATKRNIQTVLALLAGKTVDTEHVRAIPDASKIPSVRPEDLVLLSVSSHGYADASGNFYFFLADIGEGEGRQITAELLRRALSSEELSRWLRDVDGGEMVLIVDACHAAATVEGEGFKPGPMGSRGLGQLAYDKGMRVLTASQADNVALESNLLQQGLLTYALIHDGLEAYQADDQPRDHIITLSEWLGYGVKRVPALYEEVKIGQIQSFARGEGSRGVVMLYAGQDDNSLKKSPALQQPALFDFTKHTRATVLVREPENLKRTESSPKKTASP